MEAPPPQKTTFKATSNDVSPTVVDTSNSVPLEFAIRNSKVFAAAFKSAKDVESAKDRRSEKNQKKKHLTIIQSSKDPTDDAVMPGRQGLVSAITHAYNTHHNLILRPDDVWQAILTQFSFYVTGHAEELRDRFVDFKGKKTLVVTTVGTLWTVDFGKMANRMVDEQIVKNIKDPEVAQWLLPDFTTTTPNDRVAASVSIMSTLQVYFEYCFGLCCGIPKVTLEGTAEDWQKLRHKLDRLQQYDLKDKLMTQWHALLAPVIDEMVASVEGQPKLDFWDKICHRHGGGSGPRYLSGWVTVFACFTKEGKWQGRIPFDAPHHQFGFKRDGREYVDKGKPSPFQYPFINTNDLPAGALSVPVLVDDNGVQYDTQMLAGQFAYQAVDGSDSGQADTIRPRTDWCIAYDGQPKSEPRQYKQGEIRDI